MTLEEEFVTLNKLENGLTYTKSSDNVASRPPVDSMASETKNKEPMDHVYSSSESTDANDIKDSIVVRDNELSALSSSTEKITSIAENDNSLESKTDVLIENEDDLTDDAESPITKTDQEVGHESELDNGRVFSGLDLNQKLCYEEVGNPDDLVSSRVAVENVSHAPTSMFQTVPEGPITHNSNKRLHLFGIDLNVAKGREEDKMVIMPGLLSLEESCVANPTKSKPLLWDLNGKVDKQNGCHSPYHASSSSSLSASSKQPTLRNIDLNLNDQTSNENTVISIFGRRVEVISIFGRRVQVKSNDKKPHMEPKFDSNVPMYGSLSSMSNHMSMPMQYMVDSGGAPFVPQIMESASSPFFNNLDVVGAPYDANSLGPPAPLPHYIFGRQFFPQHVDEQASLSSFLGKRHEPDSGREYIPVNKHHQPLWR